MPAKRTPKKRHTNTRTQTQSPINATKALALSIADAVNHDNVEEAVRLTQLRKDRLDPHFSLWDGLLFQSAASGAVNCLKKAMELGGHWDLFHAGGYTAFHAAAINAHADIVELLLAAGADPMEPDKFGMTALHGLCMGVFSDDGARTMELLLNAGLNPDSVDSKGKSPLAVAIEAGTPEAISLLLCHGANCKSVDANGDTLLHVIARQDKGQVREMTALLHDAAAAMEAVNARGHTPLMEAALTHNAEAVTAFADVFSQTAQTWAALQTPPTGETAFHLVVRERALECLQPMLEHFPAAARIADAKGTSPLALAERLHWHPGVRLLQAATL